MRRRLLLALAVGVLLAGCGGEQTVSPTAETVIGTIPGQVDLEAGNAGDGKAVFTEISDPKCSSCHTYGPAGSNAEVGPDLDTALKGKSAEFVLESIVSPDAEITTGFADNLMPEDYASKLDQQQLADLVAFLRQGS